MNSDFLKICEDIEAIGIKKGDEVLFHSSLKSMGYVEGGAETFIKALLFVVGDSGTIIAPTLSYSFVTEENPFYNHEKTPSCVGAISEYVRTMEGAKRSIHPSHSCAAVGKNADFYVNGHEKDNTPVGENSPFYKLCQRGGKILMLGCGAGPNTSMHGVEEKAGVSYALSKYPIEQYIKVSGEEYRKAYYRHRIRQNGYRQKYERLLNVLEDYKKGVIHGAESFLMESDKVWKAGEEAIKKNEFYFVEKVEK